MHQDASPAREIEAAVARGDRRRRLVAARRAAARVAPALALAVVLVTLVARLVSGPSWLVLAGTAVGVASLAAVAVYAGWKRGVRDAAVLELDGDAGLEGELRSAAWFARTDRDTAWTRFHLAASADCLRAIHWSEVYPSAPAARRWVTSVGLVLVALTVGFFPAHGAAPSADAPAAAPAAPTTLPPDVIEALAALANGTLTPEQAREVTRAILDRDDVDPALRRQLESLMAQTGQQDGSQPGSSDQMQGQQQGGEGAEAQTEMPPPDVEWALSETAARLANENAQGSPSDAPPPDADAGETEAADTGEQSGSGAGKPQDNNAERDTGDTGDVGGLAIETDEASAEESSKGEGRSSAGSGRTERGESLMAEWELGQALDREVLRAEESARGRNIQVEERHRTEERESALALTGADPRQDFAAPPIGAATVIPETRRPLVERYFIRDAE